MNNLFENINNNDIEKLLKELEANTLTYKKDLTILSTVKNQNIIGFVVYGFIQIIKTDYNGNVTVVEDIKENSIFGSMFSNISNNEYQIITKEETKIIILDYDYIISKNNNLYYNIQNLLKITFNKISEKNDRIEILSQKTIRNKLLKYLEIQTKKTGSKSIYYSSNNLASYIAVDRSAMWRELKNLEEDRIIEINNKVIKIKILN